MRWPGKPNRDPGEYPESFVKGWMARTLPSATQAEAASAVRHLRSKGWTEQQLADFILPYMPRGVLPPPAQQAGAQEISLPSNVTRPWLDRYLPRLDRHQLRLVVDELERRGWPSGTVAMAVLPHLMPMLPADDARAIVSGLADLGMTDDEIARATMPR